EVDSQNQLAELFRGAKKQGIEVVPEPKGRPIFMFFPVAGTNKPVLTFFDSGCSDAVVREGIPGVEWRGCITKRGPFNMGGVGGLQSQTKDEWMCLVPRVDNRLQAVRCHSMNKVTGDFPMYDVTKAVNEVKADDPMNQLLQNCRVPEIIGGEVDCLMGIKYSLLHPEPLHTLATSGLSIYATKLKSHDGKFDAMIGGPHESFEFFSSVAGGVQNLLHSFQIGLQEFRNGGMPRILGNPVTFEEIECAKKSNLKFGMVENLTEKLLGEDGMFEEFEAEEIKEVVQSCACCGDDVTFSQDAAETEGDASQFQDPGATSDLTVAVNSEERIIDFKKWKKLMDSGINIEYRCIRCR
ncbi:MAG: hypothetical protein GY934_10585, partial [Gammaproteobacteria bacterium]|nr:hypothetical protein [Gammaproteobacteria bacterium]